MNAAEIRTKIAALKAEREKQKAISEGNKIALNGGGFGKMGSSHSFLYAPSNLIAVTVTGQLALMMLIERCEEVGASVKSANTDGLVLYYRNDLEAQVQAVLKLWEHDTSFMLEQTRYKALYNSSVNSYIAVKTDGKVKTKGPINNPWATGDLRGQMSKNPQFQICGDAVVQLATKGRPLEDTIRSCTDPRGFVTVRNVKGGASWRGHKLGRVVRFYWSTNGDSLVYVGTNNRVSKSEGAKPLMELTETLPKDIDYPRYIAEAKKLAIDLAVIEGYLPMEKEAEDESA